MTSAAKSPVAGEPGGAATSPGSTTAASTLRATIVIEYPARPEHYPGCDGDPVKMAAYDQRSFDDGELDVVDIGEWKSVVIEAVA